MPNYGMKTGAGVGGMASLRTGTAGETLTTLLVLVRLAPLMMMAREFLRTLWPFMLPFISNNSAS